MLVQINFHEESREGGLPGLTDVAVRMRDLFKIFFNNYLLDGSDYQTENDS